MNDLVYNNSMTEKRPAKLDLVACAQGVHPFEKLAVIETPSAAGDAAIRWCPQCGTVVVDLEKKGRLIRPGGVVRERIPEVTRATLKIARFTR